MSDFEDASLILTPNAYKAGKAYCVKPFDGSGDLTVVRNTTATRVNENGLIEVVGANVPRVNYPIGGGCPSWLIEGQSTNLLPNSEDFSNSSWLKFQSNLNSSTILSPNGVNFADTLIENTSTNTHYIRKQVGVTNNELYYQQVYVKSNGANWCYLGGLGRNPSENEGYVWFDLVNGVVGTAINGFEGFIKSEDNGWYLIKVKTSVAPTSIEREWRLGISDANGIQAYTGDGVSGIYIWGAQLEQDGLTSYIPTNGTAVTRNADVFSKANVANLIGQTEGTVFIHAKKMGGSSISSVSYFSISDGSSSNRLRIISGSSDNTLRCIFQLNGNQLVFDYNNVPFNVDGENKLAFKYKSGDMAFFLNGVLIGDSASTLTISNPLNFIGFTDQSGSNVLDFACEYYPCVIFKTALSDTKLQQLTTI